MEKEMLIHMLQKMDSLAENVGQIKESQARTEMDIKYHIKRTDLLEEAVGMLKRQVDLLMTPVALVSKILRYIRLIK
jgi:hypothetical protein